MGFFDLFRRKTDDEKELEEINNRAKAAAAAQARPIPTMSLQDTIPEVKKLISEDRKIYAVKYVKDNTGVGLKEAKDFVDKIEAE